MRLSKSLPTFVYCVYVCCVCVCVFPYSVYNIYIEDALLKIEIDLFADAVVASPRGLLWTDSLCVYPSIDSYSTTAFFFLECVYQMERKKLI